MTFFLGLCSGALLTIAGLVFAWHLEDRKRDRRALEEVTRAVRREQQ